MNEQSNLIKKGLTAVLVVVILILGARWYVNVQQSAFLSITNDLIFEQETKLTTMSQSLSNSSLPSDAPIIADCVQADRYRFDELLSNLSGLSRAQLLELDGLFGGCAHFFATVQSVKTASLAREVEVYRDLLRTASTIDSEAEAKLTTAVDQWNQLVSHAQEQSLLVSELVTVQAEIIDLLLEFNSINSEVVQAQVSRGQEVRENIVFLEQQMNEVRRALNES